MSGNGVRTTNVAIIGSGSSGKTQLADTLLYNAKVVQNIGRVADRTSNMVLEEEEFEHLTTISASLATIEINNIKFNIIDTPGQSGFIGETINALQAVDSVIFVLNAQIDIKQETELLVKYTNMFALPTIFFINKMDAENADFYKSIREYGTQMNIKMIPLTIPVGSGKNFTGLYNLLDKKAYLYSGDASGRGRQTSENAPPGAEESGKELIEAVAESDDALLEKYLNNEKLKIDDLLEPIKRAVLSGSIFPVVPGSALLNIGVDKLIEFCSIWLPSHDMINDGIILKSPDDGSAYKVKRSASEKTVLFVFKTTVDPYAGKLSYARIFSGKIVPDTVLYNASTGTEEKINHIYTMLGKKSKNIDAANAGDIVTISKLQTTGTGDTLKAVKDTFIIPQVYKSKKLVAYAVKPKGKSDDDKITQTLHKILEENTSLSLRRDAQLKELILEGVSKEQLEMVIHKAKRKYGVDLDMVLPGIPYKETIKTGTESQGKYKKQSGGRGQYGDVWLRLKPLSRGKGIEFVNKIVGGAIPRQYIPAIEKGVREIAAQGFLAGFPVVDFSATVYDGSFHTVDSSEIAFKIAASFAFKKCMENASPVLLEPIMLITVIVPEVFTGEVMGGLNSKRAKILGMETYENKKQLIKVHVPLMEVQSYGDELRSITKGMGTFDIEFYGYEEVSAHISEKIIGGKNKKEVKV